MLAARLREVAAGGDAQPGRQTLQKNCHETAQQDDAEQRIAEF